MTQTFEDVDHRDMTESSDQDELSAEASEAFRRDYLFASGERLEPDYFPRLMNLSVGFMKRAIVRPVALMRPEYVTVSMPSRASLADEQARTDLVVAEWNMLWEAGQFRRRFFDEDELPAELSWIADRGDHNIIFVPRTASRYFEYAPLFHLLSRRTLERFGLPLLKAGQWPYTMEPFDLEDYLPADFEARLAKAWAWTVWPHLNSGSPLTAFSTDEPIQMLAHNLDFWLPAVTDVIQQELQEFAVTVGEGTLPAEVRLTDGSVLKGAVPGWPRKGGEVWCGEEQAAGFVEETVERADSTGQLRAIMDAVKSHRVRDDFSARWSYAREDFERKLYRKRNKVSVRFVELTDSIPVQGPETEIEGRIVTADFMALLRPREREVVVLLASGLTNLTDVARELGYANHSPISKQLAKIRRKAANYFDQN